MVTYWKLMARPARTEKAAPRNPGRTRERILTAALKEFAAKGVPNIWLIDPRLQSIG